MTDRAAIGDVQALLVGAEPVDESVATVYRVRLPEGRPAILKLHRPEVGERFLRAVGRVQRHAATVGFPAPGPLAGPLAHGDRLATVEALLEEGSPPDGHDPALRAAMAAGLARLVDVCRPLAHLTGLSENPWRLRPGELWPAPEAGRPADAALEDVAARARAVCATGSGGPLVVGHTDWRAQNLRCAGGRLTAVYDWESLDLLDEAVLAGQAAAIFTADWSAGAATFPSPEESLAFVADYDRARGRPFTPREHVVARAATAYMAAFVTRRGDANLRSHLRRWREERV